MATQRDEDLFVASLTIAAVAGASGCIVMTDNGTDFAGLQIINPLRGMA